MTDPNCPFCQIVAGKIGQIIWKNDQFSAFYDIKPKADTHILIVPNEHIENLDDLRFNKEIEIGLFEAAKTLAKQLNLADGYRLILNNKAGGGQVVPHLHLHLLKGNLPEF
jgi:histidine triad (HIT) family protein